MQSISEYLEKNGFFVENDSYVKYDGFRKVTIDPSEWIGLDLSAFIKKAEEKQWIGVEEEPVSPFFGGMFFPQSLELKPDVPESGETILSFNTSFSFSCEAQVDKEWFERIVLMYQSGLISGSKILNLYRDGVRMYGDESLIDTTTWKQAVDEVFKKREQ